MKTYEIFTEKYSQIIQAGNLRAAIKKFIDGNPGDEIIGIHNVKYNDKLLSSPTPLKQLSEITDEDLKECVNILLKGHNDEKIDDDSMARWMKIVKLELTEGGYHLQVQPYWKWILSVYQYLQFKGYDVPQYYPVSKPKQLSDEEIKPHRVYFKRGSGVFDKELYDTLMGNISRLNNRYRELKKSVSQSDHINPIELLEWVDVKERLPKDDKNNSVYCLVKDNYGIVVRPYNQEHNCWDDEDSDDYYTDAIGGKITHWMPLPAPPKI